MAEAINLYEILYYRYRNEDPYVVLDIPRSCSYDEAAKAFRSQVLQVHPDKAPDASLVTKYTELFQLLRSAFDKIVIDTDGQQIDGANQINREAKEAHQGHQEYRVDPARYDSGPVEECVTGYARLWKAKDNLDILRQQARDDHRRQELQRRLGGLSSEKGADCSHHSTPAAAVKDADYAKALRNVKDRIVKTERELAGVRAAIDRLLEANQRPRLCDGNKMQPVAHDEDESIPEDARPSLIRNLKSSSKTADFSNEIAVIDATDYAPPATPAQETELSVSELTGTSQENNDILERTIDQELALLKHLKNDQRLAFLLKQSLEHPPLSRQPLTATSANVRQQATKNLTSGAPDCVSVAEIVAKQTRQHERYSAEVATGDQGDDLEQWSDDTDSRYYEQQAGEVWEDEWDGYGSFEAFARAQDKITGGRRWLPTSSSQETELANDADWDVAAEEIIEDETLREAAAVKLPLQTVAEIEFFRGMEVGKAISSRLRPLKDSSWTPPSKTAALRLDASVSGVLRLCAAA